MSDDRLHLSRGAGASRPVAGRAGTPFPGALLVACIGALLLLKTGPVVAPPQGVVAGATIFAAGALLMLAGLARNHPHAGFGPANAVTLLRLALVSALVAAVAGGAGAPPWVLAGIAGLSLALDGVDGWLARRTGLASRFGARFDMEVDCLFALALAALVFASGKVGIWVLGLGLARYAFWGASLVLPWLAADLPERASRKLVCVFQIVVLILLVTPPVQPPVASWLAAAALGLVAWSFAVDLRHLHARRP